MEDRKQRILVDGMKIEHFIEVLPRTLIEVLPRNSSGPCPFSIMVNDIKTVDPVNQLVKFAEDIEVPGNENGDTSQAKVDMQYTSYKYGLKIIDCP